MGVTVRSASGQGHQEQQSRKSLMFGRDLFFFLRFILGKISRNSWTKPNFLGVPFFEDSSKHDPVT